MTFPDSVVNHVVNVTLGVTNFDRSIQFYKTILGLTVLKQTPNRVVLGTKDPILILKKVDTVVTNQAGLYHIAYLLNSEAMLGAWLKSQRENETPIEGTSDLLVSKAIYLSDPDGHGIEVYADTASNTWQYNHGEINMATKPLDYQALLAKAVNPYNADDAELQIGHVHLRTKELNKVRHYYESVGFNSTLDMGHATFMSDEDYHHHIAINTWGRFTDYTNNSNNVLEMTVYLKPDHPKKNSTERDSIGITINYI